MRDRRFKGCSRMWQLFVKYQQKPCLSMRLHNRRITARRLSDDRTQLIFEYCIGHSIMVNTFVISDEAFDAMVALRCDLRNREYVKEQPEEE